MSAPVFPARYADLKRTLVPEEAEVRVTAAWKDLLQELSKFSDELQEKKATIIPQIEFKDLAEVTPEQLAAIKRCGAVVIKNVIDDERALQWKETLRKYVEDNPGSEGYPEDNKQVFHLYWSKPQVQARSQGHVLEASTFVNKLWHSKKPSLTSLGVSLTAPLTYADRFHLRPAAPLRWDGYPPQVTDTLLQRWDELLFKKCYEDILEGKWREHDAYAIDGRLTVGGNFPGNRFSTTLLTFRGWLALSETGPNEGTLQVFPDLLLSSAYAVLRPFFRPVSPPVSTDPFDHENWVFDVSVPNFPGVNPEDVHFVGRFGDASHPHLRLGATMCSMPRVNPGDMIFWHCDAIHGIEVEHNGANDCSAIYISAMPTTPGNLVYNQNQKDRFMSGEAPPDYSATQKQTEAKYAGRGVVTDISESGRKAMGFEGFEGTPVPFRKPREPIVEN